jgi:hypothetical protein
MPDQPPFHKYDELSEARIVRRAYLEVERAMDRANAFLDRVKAYEKAHKNRATILSDLKTMTNEADDFTSRWTDLWNADWGK